MSALHAGDGRYHPHAPRDPAPVSPAPIPYHYIRSAQPLTELVARLRGADRVALDTEADSLYHYREKVCVFQLSFSGVNYIVDPLAGLDLAELSRVLEEKALIIHGADYDLRMMRISLGFRPRRGVSDTMLAAQLLGYRQFGLAALAERFFGVVLSKHGQKSDWSRRPLTPSHLDYLVRDTHYLHGIAERLEEELRACGRDGWHRESCARAVDATMQDSPRDHDEVWRMKGTGRFDRRQLSYLRELWRWRDAQARAVDLPPFKVLGNDQLIALALAASGAGRKFRVEGVKLPRNCVGQRLEALEGALERGRGMREEEWPERLPRRVSEPYPFDLMEKLRGECARCAGELGLDPAVVASRATLISVARERPQTDEELAACGPMMHWQAELLAPRFRQLIRRTVRGNRRHPRASHQ
ncbi:MAG: HRDC domain-containing protein [Candidatus Aureabacteria bacterium]|nr:HRDC domain-containing protein [Candidatus Auribacterota bacterium]